MAKIPRFKAMCEVDPEGVEAICRGLSAATPPVKSKARVLDPGRGRSNLNGTLLSATPPGSDPIDSAATGGVAALNPRTRARHLPAGLLSVPAVTAFTVFCAAAFLASTALFLLAEPSNPWPVYLGVPVLGFVCAYSLTKRFTALAHFWLGASLFLAPLGAWIAIRGLEHLEVAAVLAAAVLFWVAGFDIIYACQDAEFDRQAKLRSIPATLGVSG